MKRWKIVFLVFAYLFEFVVNFNSNLEMIRERLLLEMMGALSTDIFLPIIFLFIISKILRQKTFS